MSLLGTLALSMLISLIVAYALKDWSPDWVVAARAWFWARSNPEKFLMVWGLMSTMTSALVFMDGPFKWWQNILLMFTITGALLSTLTVFGYSIYSVCFK